MIQKLLLLTSLLASSAFGFSPLAQSNGAVRTSLKVSKHVYYLAQRGMPMMTMHDAFLRLASATRLSFIFDERQLSLQFSIKLSLFNTSTTRTFMLARSCT
jgi:hypothetical protein